MMFKVVSGVVLAALGICGAGNEMRAINARDLVGTFTLSSLGGCPKKMYYGGVVSGGNAMEHGDMMINGIKCEANGEMELIAMTKERKLNEVVKKLKDETRELAVKVLSAVPRGSYVGVSSKSSKCGPITFDAGSLFVFAKSNENIDFGDPLIEPMPAYRRILIIVQPRRNYMCTYTAKLRESPSPTPSNSPTPSPSKKPVRKPSDDDDSEVHQSSGDVEDTQAPSPSPEVGDAVCFPCDALVSLRDGSTKMMSEVAIGDEVQVGEEQFSTVFMFTHKLGKQMHNFVSLSTLSGHKITLTEGHYLVVNGSFRVAGSVVVGDELTLGNGASSMVAEVNVTRKMGLYNPQTVHGAILVNGVLASTYTNSVAPQIAHSILAPLRAGWNMFGYILHALEGGADKTAALMPRGSNVL